MLGVAKEVADFEAFVGLLLDGNGRACGDAAQKANARNPRPR